MDKNNITAKQFKIHKQNWELIKRKIINKLWGQEFGDDYGNPALVQFLRKAGRLKILKAEFLENSDIYSCDCGYC